MRFTSIAKETTAKYDSWFPKRSIKPLIAVRNFFRETAPDQSVYDELLVVRPPKRIVGGVTMRF